MFATPAEDSPLKAVDFGISVFCEPGQYITARAGRHAGAAEVQAGDPVRVLRAGAVHHRARGCVRCGVAWRQRSAVWPATAAAAGGRRLRGCAGRQARMLPVPALFVPCPAGTRVAMPPRWCARRRLPNRSSASASTLCPLRNPAGTRIVMAPEVVRERYGLPADLWSAGVVGYLLLTGRLPFPFWDKMYVQRQVSTFHECVLCCRLYVLPMFPWCMSWELGVEGWAVWFVARSARPAPQPARRACGHRVRCPSTQPLPLQAVTEEDVFADIDIANRRAIFSLPQAVTEKDLFADICGAPLDFEAPPWDALSGGRASGGPLQRLWQAGRGSRRAVPAVQQRALPPPNLNGGDWRSVPPPPHRPCPRPWPARCWRPPLPPADARDFVSRLLQRDERRRPSAEEALRHPWLQPEAVQVGAGDGGLRGRLEGGGGLGRRGEAQT